MGQVASCHPIPSGTALRPSFARAPGQSRGMPPVRVGASLSCNRAPGQSRGTPQVRVGASLSRYRAPGQLRRVQPRDPVRQVRQFIGAHIGLRVVGGVVPFVVEF